MSHSGDWRADLSHSLFFFFLRGFSQAELQKDKNHASAMCCNIILGWAFMALRRRM